jgi:fibronectin type 3 domain-containing protein
LEYVEDGWFYIRSRFSAKCITVVDSSTDAGANIMQWDKNNSFSQQWRLLPVGSPVEFNVPNYPNNLAGTADTNSIHLTWDASTSDDVAGYTIFRAESDGEYNTIARNVTSSFYDDASITSGVEYYYKINAVDSSLNRSSNSNIIGPIKASDPPVGVESNESEIPSVLALEQNYPNPFNRQLQFHIKFQNRDKLAFVFTIYLEKKLKHSSTKTSLPEIIQ